MYEVVSPYELKQETNSCRLESVIFRCLCKITCFSINYLLFKSNIYILCEKLKTKQINT